MAATLGPIVREARIALTTDNDEYIVLKAAWRRDSPTNINGKETDGTANQARLLKSVFGKSEDASYLLDIMAGVCVARGGNRSVQQVLQTWSRSRAKYGAKVLSRVREDWRLVTTRGVMALARQLVERLLPVHRAKVPARFQAMLS